MIVYGDGCRIEMFGKCVAHETKNNFAARRECTQYSSIADDVTNRTERWETKFPGRRLLASSEVWDCFVSKFRDAAAALGKTHA